VSEETKAPEVAEPEVAVEAEAAVEPEEAVETEAAVEPEPEAAAAPEAAEPNDYAKAKEQLDAIVGQVRHKDVSLEKSLDLLEEGVRLANRCTELIDRAAWEDMAVAEDEENEESAESDESEKPVNA